MCRADGGDHRHARSTTQMPQELQGFLQKPKTTSLRVGITTWPRAATTKRARADAGYTYA